jgi:hypothetical protein
MSRLHPTFFPGKHTVKEFELYGISRVQMLGRWVTIDTQSAYDKHDNLLSRGVRVKIKAF